MKPKLMLHPVDWLSVREVAGLIHLSTDLIYDACAKGELQHVKLGRKLRLRRDWVDAWLDAHTVVLRQG